MRSRIPRTIAAVLLVGVGAGQYLGMPTAWLRHPTGDWDDVGAMDRVEGACSGAAFAAGAGEAL